MPHPTLSVVMPNYNHARYLPVALEALLAQSYPALEIIVVDDGSNDDSREVLATFARRDARIKLVCHETNQGVIAASNRGFALCQGDYVYGAGADDEVLPGFFECALRMLADHPHAGLCCGFPSYVEVVGHQGNFVADDPHWSKQPCYFTPRQLVDRLRVRVDGQRVGRSIYSPATICRRDALQAAGCYRPRLHWQADYVANHTIAFRHGICYIPRTMALFFKRQEAYSGRGRKDPRIQQEIGATLARLLLEGDLRDVCIPMLASGVMAPQESSDPRWTPIYDAVRQYLASDAGGMPTPHFAQAAATRVAGRPDNFQPKPT